MQKFYASKTDTFIGKNGAIGHRPGGSFDCLGPYAKVSNCPIAGTDIRRTAYATAYSDTFFSVPACTRYKGKYIKGYFSNDDDGIVFHVMDAYKDLLNR